MNRPLALFLLAVAFVVVAVWLMNEGLVLVGAIAAGCAGAAFAFAYNPPEEP